MTWREDIETVREALDDLYHYTADQRREQEPARGRSLMHHDGRAALDRIVERLGELEVYESEQELAARVKELEAAVDGGRFAVVDAPDGHPVIVERRSEARAALDRVERDSWAASHAEKDKLIWAAEARIAELERVVEAARFAAAKQPEALAMIEHNGFVFTDIGKEPGNWQHLAFSLYTELCEIESHITPALAALDGKEQR